ncbi:2,3-bisphosphoglycerate-independent phosphoglycerate mutase [Candidatus Dojkabacteria bacterium]|nr:2,3-bisphosphoglycerate-independent phosphoglycerate mutase [Candidatus Dojkabacteria bacterium]
MTKSKNTKPFVLLVIDGLGISDIEEGNAVKSADTPNLKRIWAKYPMTQLQASGLYVGLPDGVMGNSEVGHMSLGAGRILFQELAKINHEIETGEFFKNEVFLDAIEHAKKNDSRLHLMGLLSDGRVHSSLEHLRASLELCRKKGLKGDQVAVHAFTDGRDTSPNSAEEYIEQVEKWMKKYRVGKIASIIGRYYAMDRDERWGRTKLAYDLIVRGKGEIVRKPSDAVKKSYDEDISDEYIKPFVVQRKKEDGPTTVKDGDSLIFFNYRADRAVQLSKAFEYNGQFNNGFDIVDFEDLYFAGFSNYEKGLSMARAAEDLEDYENESDYVAKAFKEEIQKTDNFPKLQVFPPDKAEHSLGKVIADAGIPQLRLAESEKYPHVTYFFNCRNKEPFEREERIEIDSPKNVKTYDQKPEMSTPEIVQKFKKEVVKKKYGFILINFALTDMVAHTGDLEASVKAVEEADRAMQEVLKSTLEVGGEILVTADHGNIEELINIRTGETDTKHSTNPVPMFLVSNSLSKGGHLPEGILADVAPTVLKRMGIDTPEEMKGRDLLG